MKNLFDDQEIITNADASKSLPLEINPQLQDKIDSLPQENSYQTEYGARQDIGPYQPEEKQKVAGFKETFIHSATAFPRAVLTGPDLNPLSDSTPSGWNAASDENNFIGVVPRNQSYVAAATSPNDAAFRRQAALEKQQQDEYFETGPMLAKIAGGFIDNVYFAWIPLGQAAKYMSLEKTVIESTMQAAPGMAVGSLLHEGAIQSHEIGGNLEDMVINAYIDTIAGLAFVGAGAGLGKAFDGLKLYDAKKVMKMNYEGMQPGIKVDADGKIMGFEVQPIGGEVLNAAKVDAAQKYLDSTFERSGLFAVPYLGGALTKTIEAANPTFRGLNSRFETIRGYTDRTASHGLITAGIKRGEAKPDDFETEMGIVMAANKVLQMSYKRLLDQRNDIDNKSSIANLAERTVKRWKDEGYVDEVKFGGEIIDTVMSGKAHEHNAVNVAAAMTREELDRVWEEYREVNGMPKEWLPPPTSKEYFPTVYDQAEMTTRPDDWREMWVNWWNEGDKIISKEMKPILDIKERINTAKLAYAANPSEESAKELAAMKRKHRVMKEALADKIQATEHYPLLADDRSALSGKESRQLRLLLKPLNKAKKELTAQNQVVEKLNQQKFFTQNKIDSAKSKPTVKKLKDELKEIETELASAKADAKKLKNKHDDIDDKLQLGAAEGKISARLYERIPDSQRVKFKKPSQLMKFREKFESVDHMEETADAFHDTIKNQTPEDTMQQIMGGHLGSASENHAKKKSLMIPSDRLLANRFMSRNLPLIMANYRNMLSRRIIMKKVFGDVTIDGGIEPIAERLTVEMKNMRESILKANLSEKEQAKELRKLEKDFNEAKEFMKLSHDRMMGRVRGGPKMRKFIRFMRNWTVATRLGSVPLTMTTDYSANIYKHGFWPTIRDGLVPALENLATRIKTGNKSEFIDNAAHAHLALETYLAANNDRDWGGMAVQEVPMSGTISNLMEKAAHVSGNISGTNQMTNNVQRLTASNVQAKIMRYMIDYKKGQLRQKDLEKMLIYGLDPKKWADRFVKGYEEKGHAGTLKGSHESRYWEWSDVEAANKMSKTIYKGVQDTVVKKGLMDAPFFFDDPIFGTLVFFHGWSTAALTRYLVPLMQRPDAEHLAGLVSMLAAGSMVAPLRRLTRGEPLVDEDSNMFKDALTDSGILTPIMNLVENANIMTNNAILRGLVNDRWLGRSFASSLGGPVVGVGEDITHILGMFLTGRLNETDLKKAARLLPAMQPWYLKGYQNKMIEGLGLPKTMSEAQSNSGNAYR